MTIVIDARCVSDELSGIDRYVLGVIEGLASVRPPETIRVLGKAVRPLLKLTDHHGAPDLVECDLPMWSLRAHHKVPALLKKLGTEVYHCPYLYAPLLGRGYATVVTAHDLIPHVRRREFQRSRKSRFFPVWNAWFRAQCAKADAIVTVSDFSKQQLMDIARLPESRLHRIYNGAKPSREGIAEDELRRRYGLRGRLVSYVGRHDPHKGIDDLVTAFAQLIQRLPADDEVTLVVGGRLDPRYPEARRMAKALNLQDRVVFTGYLQDDERVALVRASSVFAYPSHHEGFGLPPLEALSEGTPVVAYDATSLPEVLGDAALLVPDSPDALCAGMQRLLTDRKLAAALALAGPRRAANFDWTRCALEHLDVYRAVAAPSRSRPPRTVSAPAPSVANGQLHGKLNGAHVNGHASAPARGQRVPHDRTADQHVEAG